MRVSAPALGRDNGVFEEEFVHLLDHLLGSRGLNPDRTLSNGHGITPGLLEYGQQIHELFQDPKHHVTDYAGKNHWEFLDGRNQLE